ncbi:MAG: hypothetical protein ACJ79L_04020 [Anaeromyxobacteraceae bacterium]
MKRAILLLATALLGTSTACTSHNNSPGNMTLFWEFQDVFGRAAGQPGDNNGCGVASVDTVDVSVDGQTQNFDCAGPNAAGITLQTFAPGDYSVTLIGRRGSEQVFRADATVRVLAGTDTATDVTLQAINPQSFVVFYNVNGAAQCNFFGLVYRLRDANGLIVSTTETTPGDANTQSPIPCDPVSFGFTVPNLPLGNYHFDYLAGVNSSNQALVQVCTKTVAHGGFADIENLTTATVSCL